MKFIAILSMLSFVGMLSLQEGCKFNGELTPNIECTDTCSSEKEQCVTKCEEDCVDAGGEDTDVACDEDCDTTCTDAYDECTYSCTGSD